MKLLWKLTLILCLFGQSAWAEPDDVAEGKPLWEAGVFAATFNGPDYPAANTRQTNFIAAPFFIYRGKIFRVGEGSTVRAVAVDTDRLELDLSLNATFNADSDGDSARQGMPDLDYVFEIGPQLKFRLKDFNFDQGSRAKLNLNLQARSAFSTDFNGIAHRGYVFHAEFKYQHHDLYLPKDQLTLEFSPIWSTEKLQDYFYQVDPQYATEDRPAYDAKGGYLGSKVGIRYAMNYSQRLRLFFGVNFRFHNGAKNHDSPLFFNTNTYSLGLGAVWQFYQSDERVNRSAN